MDFETLEFEVRDHVAHITLNRPQDANAMDVQMSLELMHASIECDETDDIRAVLVTGNGKMFSAGGDLKSFAASRGRIRHLVKEMTVYLHGAISRFGRMDAPVIMCVNGTAANSAVRYKGTHTFDSTMPRLSMQRACAVGSARSIRAVWLPPARSNIPQSFEQCTRPSV